MITLRRKAPIGDERRVLNALIIGVLLYTGACAQAPDVLPGADVPLVLESDVLNTPGFGEFSFTARSGNTLEVKFYRASAYTGAADPVWFVMHGASRDAERYIELAAPVAERHRALALTIKFPKSLYPRSGDYTLNVTTQGRADADALKEGRWAAPDAYLYNEIERLFDAVRAATGGVQAGYFIFGHSAGAQFTHRMLTFMPDNRVLRAVAANAGWYTLPLRGPDVALTMPYGLGSTPVDDAMRRELANAPLTILVGERDLATPAESSMVLDTPPAMAQGSNRLERARHYFAAGQVAAAELDTELRWNFAVVPRAGHSARQMVTSAAHFLFNDEPAGCEPTAASAAAGLRITELLADPPANLAGDANRDTVRDSNADEFIELTNTSAASICLAGWAIGDARKTARHVFPLGTVLRGGGKLVVFGGGQPTGAFDDALVQWAAFDGKLSLTNAGDVITLRDADNRIADQVSWGDCAAQACAADHYPDTLDIARSIVRSGVAGQQAWQPIADVGNRLFTPGFDDESVADSMELGEQS